MANQRLDNNEEQYNRNDEEHRDRLDQGADEWNRWRKENPDITPELRGTSLIFADLSGVNLSGANLREADLTGADFTNADLTGADLVKANLTTAKLGGARLNEADLRASDLRMADFRSANLEKANLGMVQALTTNFAGAKLTGACIKHWNTSGETDLSNVNCDYIYFKEQEQDRYPIDRNFVPGEFTKHFQKASNTIELQFKNGLDWQAFSLSFSKLIIENEDAGMVVQGIDIKEDGVVIVKVKLDSDADKVKFHQSFMQGYELAQKTLEPQYQRRELQYERSLQDKSETLNHLFFLVQKYQEQLGEVPKLMAENSKPITNQTTINTSTIGFVQSGSGTISNFSQNIGQNADEIVCLINSLRSIAQVFPEVEREEVAMHLDDLQNDKLIGI